MRSNHGTFWLEFQAIPEVSQLKNLEYAVDLEVVV